MNFPKIDLTSLPDLDTLTGLFGSMQQVAPTYDDRIIVLATVVFERQPPGGGLI